MAATVSAGLTAAEVGSAPASVTKRFDATEMGESWDEAEEAPQTEMTVDDLEHYGRRGYHSGGARQIQSGEHTPDQRAW